MRNIATTFCLLFIACFIRGQNNNNKELLQGLVEKNKDAYADIAEKIWEYAELGYEENKSSLLLQQHLEAEQL